MNNLLANRNSEWYHWCKKVNSDNDESVVQVIKRHIQEGKDVFLIPCPPMEDGLKKLWKYNVKKILFIFWSEKNDKQK